MNRGAIAVFLLLIILAIIIQLNITITRTTRQIPLWGILWNVRIRPKDIWDTGTKKGRLVIFYGHRELVLMIERK